MCLAVREGEIKGQPGSSRGEKGWQGNQKNCDFGSKRDRGGVKSNRLYRGDREGGLAVPWGATRSKTFAQYRHRRTIEVKKRSSRNR